MKKLLSIFGAAALGILSACTTVRYIKLNVKCNHPDPQTLCLKGDVEHKCAKKILKDWANQNCEDPTLAKITKIKDDEKCIRCKK